MVVGGPAGGEAFGFWCKSSYERLGGNTKERHQN